MLLANDVGKLAIYWGEVKFEVTGEEYDSVRRAHRHRAVFRNGVRYSYRFDFKRAGGDSVAGLKNTNIEFFVRQFFFKLRPDQCLRKLRAVNRNIDLIKEIRQPSYVVFMRMR
jgi:hypothetical protein